MPEHVDARSTHGFLIVVGATVLASIIVLPLIDWTLRKFGLVK